jgi:hypothetical protein
MSFFLNRWTLYPYLRFAISSMVLVSLTWLRIIIFLMWNLLEMTAIDLGYLIYLTCNLLFYSIFANVCILDASNCKMQFYKVKFFFSYTCSFRSTVANPGLPWLLIMGSRFDDWIYWYFFTITVDYERRLSESPWRISKESFSDLGLISTDRIHECTACYNCHADRIEVTMSNSSSVLFFCHGNTFIFVAAVTSVNLTVA